MKYTLIVIFLSVFFLSQSVNAEEILDEDAHMGSAGWDLDYGFDEELDEDRDSSQEEDQKDKKNKDNDQDDFFTRRIEVYDIGTRDVQKTSPENIGNTRGRP